MTKYVAIGRDRSTGVIDFTTGNGTDEAFRNFYSGNNVEPRVILTDAEYENGLRRMSKAQKS